MTLSVLEGHFPIAGLFKWGVSYLWHFAQSLCIYRASCFIALQSQKLFLLLNFKTDAFCCCVFPWSSYLEHTDLKLT